MSGKLRVNKRQFSPFLIGLTLSILLTTSLTRAFCEDYEDMAYSPQPIFCCEETNCSPPPTIEVKCGYFFFSDSKMRKIYDRGGWDVQISGSYPIWKWLQVYGSAEYLEKYGKSLHDHQNTTIQEYPLSIGLKPVITICPGIQYYFTLGPRVFILHQHNSSSYVNKNISRCGLGGFVNTGFNFIFCDEFFLDIFGEYSYKKIHFHSSRENVETRNIQVGGYTFGLGLGYSF